MRIDIVLKVIKLNSFPPLPPLSYSVPPPPPPPHLYCFPSTTTTTTATTFLLFSLHHHHYHHHISIVFLHHHHRHQHHHISIVFLHHHHHHISIVLLHDSQYKTANYYDKFSLSQCLKLSRTVVVFFNSQLFVQLISDSFLLRTASPQQLHALVQVLYNILKEYILIPEENKRILQPYKDALLNLAETNVPYKTKKRILVRSSVNQSLSGILKPSLFPPSAVLGHGLIRISP